MTEPAQTALDTTDPAQTDPTLAELLARGLDAHRQGRLDEAQAFYARVLDSDPENADALHLLGVVATARHQPAIAVALIGKALQVAGEQTMPRLNLGNALQALGRFDEAIAAYRQVLAREPDHLEALVNLGGLLQELDRLGEARPLLERAVALGPDNAQAHWHLALALLAQGELARGWDEFDWRWRTAKQGPSRRAFPQPLWRGEKLAGKTLLVWPEQGLGDQILFSSILPELAAEAERLVIETDPRLMPLLSRALAGRGAAIELVPATREPEARLKAADIDFQIAIGGLAALRRRRFHDFPKSSGYLAADPLRAAQFRRRLDALGPGLKVGLCWRSGLREGARQFKFVELEKWAPVLTRPGLVLVNLQYDECEAELREAERRFGITIHRFDDLDLFGDLDGVAALISALDVVVSAPTVVCEMAGALGVPAWRICRERHWSMLGSKRSPWMPSLRLFPQAALGGWDAALTKAARGLETQKPRAMAIPPGLPDPDPAALHLAAAAHLLRKGQLDRAQNHAQAALALSPDHVPALSVAAAVLQARGQTAAAESLLRQALARSPGQAALHANLGAILAQAGRVAEAVESFTRALALAPTPNTRLNLAVALRQAGRAMDSARQLDMLLAEVPTAPEAWFQKAETLVALGDEAGALAAYGRALALAPALAAARLGLGNLHLAQGRAQEAAQAFREIVAAQPGFAPAWQNLAVALRALDRPAEAQGALEDFLRLEPNTAVGWSALGDVLKRQDRTADSLAAYDRALALAPDFAEAHANKGNALFVLGRAEEALACHRQAVAARPDWITGHANLAMALLATGHLAEGWVEYEWRRQDPRFRRDFPQAWWNGEALEQGAILLWGEQGLGDEITFASMIPDVLAREPGARVVVECDPRLVPLFARSFPRAEVAGRLRPPAAELCGPEFSYQCALGSLGRLLRTTADSFPQTVAYLRPDPARRDSFKAWLDSLGPGPKVGLCWRSQLREGAQALKFRPLTEWTPLLTRPGLVLVNLQYDECEAELAQAEAELGVTIHRPALDLHDDLDGVAALIAALDLVASAPTMVCEMAGALGVTAWRLCAHPHWSLLGQDSSPWMPSLKSFAASALGGWTGVFEAAAQALDALIAARPSPETMLRQGRWAEAEALARTRLAAAPDDAQAWGALGLALASLGRTEDARTSLERAVSLAPDQAAPWANLGSLHAQAGRLEEAVACFGHALARRANPQTLLNLGQALLALGRPREAARHLAEAARLAPDHAPIWQQWGLALQAEDDPAAIDAFERSAALKPSAEALNNLGVALRTQCRFDEALLVLRRATGLDPAFAPAWSNLGHILADLEHMAEAEAAYAHALALDPAYAEVRWNLALTLLTQGKLAQGWAEYERRWEKPALAATRRPFPQPWWDGSALAGKPLLVWGEQGLGDQILFSSCLPDLFAAGAEVAVECDPRLVGLFARSFPQARVVGRSHPPDPALESYRDGLQIPLASLPPRLRPTLDSFPAGRAWLTADPARRAAMRAWLDGLGDGPKVGLCWRSARLSQGRRCNYADLEEWAPLLTRPGLVWVNLQYDSCEDELAKVETALGIGIHRPPLDQWGDLDGVAALIRELDLVISAPTMVCEMAGALGVRAWRMCRQRHWSTLGLADSPWMASLRVFALSDHAAPGRGGWRRMFEAAAQALPIP